MSTPILAIENLTKKFGRVTAVAGIDMSIEEPGVYGFLGPNGAGKSTTFKIMCTLLRPTSGRVAIFGVDVVKEPRRAVVPVGVQFDSSPFYPYLNGRDNLHVIAKWLDNDPGSQRIEELLTQVGLSDAGKRRVSEYSWGMRQRLGLASALLSDPKLVVLDEPTNGLDPGGIADMRALLPRLAREEGRTIMLSSHRMDEVEQVCDHVTIIHEGSIVASGKPRELASDDGVVVVTCDDSAAARDTLDSLPGLGSTYIASPTILEISDGEADAAAINRHLVTAGISVQQVMTKHESLEDAFFRLTGATSHSGSDSESSLESGGEPDA